VYERRSTATFLIVLGVTILAGPVSLGDDPIHPYCRLLLREEAGEREDLELAVELAASERVATEEIFGLLDGLWKNDAVQRLVYLAGKHDRDVAKLAYERQGLLLERQDALIDQLRLVCGETPSEDLSESDRLAYDRAHARYLKADCGRLAKQTEMARVDLAYRQELLESMRDLRENDVATRQDVILAERDLAKARQRLEQGGPRVERCRSEFEALEAASASARSAD
jgi:hypothetical protein